MIFNEQAQKYHALDAWFQTPQGRGVSRAFLSELEIIQEKFKGDRLLQLGHCGENSWLSALSYREKLLISPCQHAKNTALFTSLQALSINRNSADCVIAPFIMEAFPKNKVPFDEIDRILKPMGYIIFFGINPWSLWGAALRWGGLACFAKNSATLNSVFSLKHAFLQRGYQQCFLNSFYYIPPVKNAKLIKNLAFFNEIGKMLVPFPAGFYCLVVQKYTPDPMIYISSKSYLQFA